MRGSGNGYRRRKWTRPAEIKTWARMLAFHIALILFGNIWVNKQTGLFNLMTTGTGEEKFKPHL